MLRGFLHRIIAHGELSWNDCLRGSYLYRVKMICKEKMNVIAKISCYFERSVVTLKLRKEYLNTVTYNTPLLLWIKYEQFDI